MPCELVPYLLSGVVVKTEHPDSVAKKYSDVFHMILSLNFA